MLMTEKEFIEQVNKITTLDAIKYARDIHLSIINRKCSYGGSKAWHKAWVKIYDRLIEGGM